MKHLILLTIMFVIGVFNRPLTTNNIVPYSFPQENTQENAYIILMDQCNGCHITKQRGMVFTRDNINLYSLAIEQQVFVKKRMPKGKKNKLTSTELNKLRLWLNSLNNH
ncbi:hypothetical protein Q2T41_16205 [Maribacter confluentis]|uniref:Haem-binding domain-containing protein n=1 Tax=Maribacter confluentis TaxID=1656093 RepID=A0ABT8RUM3_9FLAO|nr:hypothetical protein [Maribacter confluentis]MDO1514197.1 hypothetical protein [Maribacter confluentis]